MDKSFGCFCCSVTALLTVKILSPSQTGAKEEEEEEGRGRWRDQTMFWIFGCNSHGHLLLNPPSCITSFISPHLLLSLPCFFHVISMAASTSTSFNDHHRIDLKTGTFLVHSINSHIFGLLSDLGAWNLIKFRCFSELKILQNQSLFAEFSEHQSVLSNLLGGIECIEVATGAKWQEEKAAQLRNSERMLQVPALLDEDGTTAGIPNQYLISYSYFYLAVVRKLQKDDLQVALYFLQALLVSPGLVWTELAPKLCQSLFPLVDLGDEEADEAVKQIARRYKDWLMYYRVMMYGEAPPWHDEYRETCDQIEHAQYWSTSMEISEAVAPENISTTQHKFEKVHPLDPLDNILGRANISRNVLEFEDQLKALSSLHQIRTRDVRGFSHIKCLQDLLQESQSDTPMSIDSFNEGFQEKEDMVSADKDEESMRTAGSYDDLLSRLLHQRRQTTCSTSNIESSAECMLQSAGHSKHAENDDICVDKFWFHSSINDLTLSILNLQEDRLNTFWDRQVEDAMSKRNRQPHDFKLGDHMASTYLSTSKISKTDSQQKSARERRALRKQKLLDAFSKYPEHKFQNEAAGMLERAISQLCLSKEQKKGGEDCSMDVSAIYEMLNKKKGQKYTLLKDMILDLLLTTISTSREDGMIRASVSILSTIVSGNRKTIEDIKKKGLQLQDLANALKRNVHEAAVLIYLIKPSPTEIITLELLPTLVEVVCSSNINKGISPELLPTPPTASLMIIEVLVTAFDYTTNNSLLATISSPRVLSAFLKVARHNNLEEFIALASILVKCMRYDEQCRKYVSKFTPVAQFICLLKSNKRRAKLIALDFFQEIISSPRSSVINVLQQIKKEGDLNINPILLSCLPQLQHEYQLLAANLLLQLDMLEEPSGKSIHRKEAIKVILQKLTSEDCSKTQQLSASILSNLGGTYAWTGESYTVAWLLKRTGLTSSRSRNLIRNFDWSDESLEDPDTTPWSSKIARRILKSANTVFYSLEKGLHSNTKRVTLDCLTAIAWLGFEVAKGSKDIEYSETVLQGIQRFLHPGFELEERILACVCLYNYASGKGMQRVIHFSEGVWESLRRLSNITWMAEELLKVSDYFLPNKSHRISCVHTQILEVGQNCSGAVNALIYYRGQLCGGYADGSIKVWEIKSQTASLLHEVREHRKAVSCFSLLEAGNSLLSGSIDKTIRVWQMTQKKLVCTELITLKEPIHSLETYGQHMFLITQNHSLKVLDATRTIKDICKTKQVKSMRVVQGKIFAGCMDSSIQEITVSNNRDQEIKAPTKSWRLQRRPINSVVMYKDWLYCASTVVEGSNIKEWRTRDKPPMSIVPDKRTNILAMDVLEDFIYLISSSSTSVIQIWLRGSQKNVGRLSAGNRITSLLTGNDIILCGTETGLIKGWIPI